MSKIHLYIKILLLALSGALIYFAFANLSDNKFIFIIAILNLAFLLTLLIVDLFKKQSLINDVNKLEKNKNNLGFLITDSSGKSLALGDKFKQLTSYNNLYNKNFLDWLHENETNKKNYLTITNFLTDSIKNNKSCSLVLNTASIAGSSLVLNFSPLADKLIFSVYQSANDLTTNLNDFLLNLPAGFLATSPNGNIISANDNFFKLLNITREEFIQQKHIFLDFVLEREELNLDDITFWEEGSSGRVKIQPKDAPAFWVWLFQNIEVDKNGVIAYIRTLLVPEVDSSTQDSKIEQTLWKSPTPTVIIDDKFSIVKSNDAFKKLTNIPNLKQISDIVKADVSLKENTLIKTTLKNDVSVRISIAKIDKKFKMLFLEDTSVEKYNEHLKKHSIIALMTGGIAHNFNNVLQAIMSLAEDLKNDYPTGSPKLQNVYLIIDRAKYASNLIKRMMNTSKNKEEKLQLTELNAEISEIKDTTLKYLLGENILINIERSKKQLYTKLDNIKLLEIMSNLISNAKDAMLQRKDNIKKGGNITIIIKEIDNQTPKQLLFDILPIGKHNMVAVADEGEGIEPKNLKRIFEPLFSTKGDNGTGFGLSTVRDRLLDINAYIDVESTVGKGTTFYMYFKPADAPIDTNTALAKAQNRAERKITTNNATIMLVDDEESVRNQLVRFFEKQGFTVITESNGNNALLTLKSTKVDLIITDESMPGMYGHELIKIAHKEFPNIKSVLISGYDETTLGLNDIKITNTTFLAKPFMLEDLLNAVHKLLND